MDGNGKYDREDLVRICQAAFGPAIEVDNEKGTGYYCDLLERDGTIRMKRVGRLCSAKTADALAKIVLKTAGVEHKSWTEEIDKKSVLKYEPLNQVVARLHGKRPEIRKMIEEKLPKESASASNV